MLKEGFITCAFEEAMTLSLQDGFVLAFCFQPCLEPNGRMEFDDAENNKA
jgi:hypothetical protein